ncbi:MAG: hypothetical protein QXS21_02015 [Thermoproteota archaeon]|nr:hypothetical protein [Candidatus Brockarchaeota archaeon]
MCASNSIDSGNDIRNVKFEELQSGLTWRTILAMIFAGLIFMPATIYLYLAVGGTAATAATYVTVILFEALSRFYGARLSRQELFILYTVIGGIGGAVPMFYWLVYRAYYVQSSISVAFSLNGVPIRSLVPIWMAPKYASLLVQGRTLLTLEWLPAILTTVTMAILGTISELSLGMMISYFYVEVEPLTFPFAIVDASIINTLYDRKESDMSYFLITLITGAIYGSFYYLFPLVLGPQAQIIPLLWIDFTPYTQYYLPGAILGVATDPASFLYGMVLQPSLTVIMFLGSLVTWVFGNTLTITTFRQFSPEWTREYFQGMSISSIVQRAGLRLWLSPFIGLGFGIALFLMITLHRKIIDGFKVFYKASSSSSSRLGYPSLPVLVALFLLGTGGSVLLYSFVLVPQVPVYLPILVSMVLSFLLAIANARLYGELGITISTDQLYNVWKATLYATSYTGYPGWIYTPVVPGSGAPWYAQETKVALMTKTKPIDLYKAALASLVITAVFGLLFMEAFWRMSPIPSTAFPYTMLQWPIYAVSDSLFATRQIAIRYNQIGLGIIVALVAGFLELVLRRIGIPFSSVGFIGGMMSLPPYTFMVMIMSFIGNYVFANVLGKEKWNSTKGIIIAGFVVGEGIIVSVSVAITLLSKATWLWPW